jgi:hypothetical protein
MTNWPVYVPVIVLDCPAARSPSAQMSACSAHATTRNMHTDVAPMQSLQRTQSNLTSMACKQDRSNIPREAVAATKSGRHTTCQATLCVGKCCCQKRTMTWPYLSLMYWPALARPMSVMPLPKNAFANTVTTQTCM